MTTTSDTTAVRNLEAALRGALIRPGGADYVAAHAVWNGMIDRFPGMIVRPADTGDVVRAVSFAREQGLSLAVRGGGHSAAGLAVCDGGMMIDLSSMREVQVDPVQRTARAQGGANWGDVDRATQAHGLATTGGLISSTGIGGLTLGGGQGWLMRRFGLAIDNLLAVEVVTADGWLVRASEAENADLFWAVRGGGGNFGVATSFEYRLFPVGPTITGGLVAHPVERARDVLRFFRDRTASLPDEHTLFAGLIHAPDGSGTKLAAMVSCHCGPLSEGEAGMRPIREFGPPIMDAIGPMSYC